MGPKSISQIILTLKVSIPVYQSIEKYLQGESQLISHTENISISLVEVISMMALIQSEQKKIAELLC